MKIFMRKLCLLILVFFICGCVSSQPSSVRIIITGNINGRILRSEEKSMGVLGTLARLGGLIQRRLEETEMPTVLLLLGNTIQMNSENRQLRAELLSQSAKMMGFEAVFPLELEFKDTPEQAKKRQSFGLPLVLTNVKPKEGLEPPVDFKPIYRFEPVKGWYVYVMNFIDMTVYNNFELLKNNYKYVRVSEAFKEIVKDIRPRDMIIIQYQTQLATDITHLYKDAEEAKKIDLIIVSRSLYSKFSSKAERDPLIQDVNIISAPINISEVQEAILTWDAVKEKWRMEQHQLQVGLNYPEHEGVKKLLAEHEEKVRTLERKDSYVERVELLMPKAGEQRKLHEPDICSSCHKSAFDIWKNSKHAKIVGRVTCDVCHQAGNPHVQFEEWLKLIPEENQKEVLAIYPTRLIDFKPDSKKCEECHTSNFDFELFWSKIKHQSDLNADSGNENRQESKPEKKQK